MSPRHRLLATCMLAALPAIAHAQATNIVPDAGALSLGTTAVRNGVVEIAGGTQAGANLFHSFSAFDLAAGDTARWVAGGGQAASVRNIVNRVTGGGISNISGTIDSTSFPNADFYFLNPAGTIFRGGATLNVPNSVYFSAASELRFASGAAFTMTTPAGGSFSIAAPESFGFVGARGDIGLSGVTSGFATQPRLLHLSGRNVVYSLSAVDSVRQDVAAVGSADLGLSLADPMGIAAAGTLTVFGTQLTARSTPALDGMLRLNGGTASLNGGQLTAFGSATARAGSVLLRAASLTTSNSAFVGSETNGVGGGGLVSINVTGAMSMQPGTIVFARTIGAAGSGPIQINAGTLTMNSALIDGRNQIGSTGAASSISITSPGDINLIGGSRVVATTLNDARGGDVAMAGRNISLSDFSRVESSTTTGTGQAGSIAVTVTDLLKLRGTSFFSSQVQGAGRGGTVTVRAGTIDLADSNTGIAANCFTAACSGNAGDLDIQADTILMGAGSRIATNTFGSGNAGSIRLKANTLTMVADAKINSKAAPKARPFPAAMPAPSRSK